MRRSINLLLLGGFVYLLFSNRFVCIFKLVFKIPCMGCGMTRAYKALLRLDFLQAIEYHCLFPIPMLWVIYYLFKKSAKIAKKTENIFLFLSVALFVIRWIFILFFT